MRRELRGGLTYMSEFLFRVGRRHSSGVVSAVSWGLGVDFLLASPFLLLFGRLHPHHFVCS